MVKLHLWYIAENTLRVAREELQTVRKVRNTYVYQEVFGKLSHSKYCAH